MKAGLYLSAALVCCLLFALPGLAQDDAKMMSEEVTIVVHHKVADFEKWLPAFESGAPMREEAGCTGITVFQDPNDPTMVTAIATVASYEQAMSFIQSEDLKKAMENAGVVGPPEIRVVRKHKTYAH